MLKMKLRELSTNRGQPLTVIFVPISRNHRTQIQNRTMDAHRTNTRGFLRHTLGTYTRSLHICCRSHAAGGPRGKITQNIELENRAAGEAGPGRAIVAQPTVSATPFGLTEAEISARRNQRRAPTDDGLISW